METITVRVYQDDVYEEVAKATDYTGSKLTDADEDARDRILAGDDDLAELGRFWEESAQAVNENFKEILLSGETGGERRAYTGVFEVSRAFDKVLTGSVESVIRSFFIASVIGQWFKFANKQEASDYMVQAGDLLTAAERLIYSRRKPSVPRD